MRAFARAACRPYTATRARLSLGDYTTLALFISAMLKRHSSTHSPLKWPAGFVESIHRAAAPISQREQQASVAEELERQGAMAMEMAPRPHRSVGMALASMNLALDRVDPAAARPLGAHGSSHTARSPGGSDRGPTVVQGEPEEVNSHEDRHEAHRQWRPFQSLLHVTGRVPSWRSARHLLNLASSRKAPRPV